MATKEIAVRSTTIRTKFLSLMLLIAIFILPISGNAGAQGTCIPRPADGELVAREQMLRPRYHGISQGDVGVLPAV